MTRIDSTFFFLFTSFGFTFRIIIEAPVVESLPNKQVSAQNQIRRRDHGILAEGLELTVGLVCCCVTISWYTRSER